MVWLWRKDGGNAGECAVECAWGVTKVAATNDSGAVMRLDGRGGEGEGRGDGGAAAPVIAYVRGEPERWALIAPAADGVRVNGVLVRGGIRMLRHRDEIATKDGGTVFFSTERIAEVEAFGGAEGTIHCVRCKLEIERGQAVVRCPGCPSLFHEFDGRRCWTYREAGCPFCKYPGTLDGQFLWTPANI